MEIWSKKQYSNMEMQKLALFFKEKRIFADK